ncbi:transposase [Streptomyces sp. NPDC059892]|uniref:transposase n=1 Tax=Streptomyces sp. NPDC059892 TaxID=3346989 RepID=UPI00365B341C
MEQPPSPHHVPALLPLSRKKTNGRKRHIVVDTTGPLPTVMVTAANVTDREAAQVLLAWLPGGSSC